MYCRSNNNTEVQSLKCVNVPICNADCILSAWSEWSDCDHRCINTTEYNHPSRTKTRTLIKKQQGKGTCPDFNETESPCRNIEKCPINGKWSRWYKKSECDKDCGNGTEVYTRDCDGPFFNGKPCLGEKTESRHCFIKPCPCDLTTWSEWSSCNANNGCGNGKRTRSRSHRSVILGCVFEDGSLLEDDESGTQLNDEKPCYTIPCTNEYYRMNKIRIRVGDAQYPGWSKDWKMTISNSKGESCTTDTFSGLSAYSEVIVSGSDLAKCKLQKKTSAEIMVKIQGLLDTGTCRYVPVLVGTCRYVLVCVS